MTGRSVQEDDGDLVRDAAAEMAGQIIAAEGWQFSYQPSTARFYNILVYSGLYFYNVGGWSHFCQPAIRIGQEILGSEPEDDRKVGARG